MGEEECSRYWKADKVVDWGRDCVEFEFESASTAEGREVDSVAVLILFIMRLFVFTEDTSCFIDYCCSYLCIWVFYLICFEASVYLHSLYILWHVASHVAFLYICFPIHVELVHTSYSNSNVEKRCAALYLGMD